MTQALSTEEKSLLKFVQIRDEIKENLNREISKISEAANKQDLTTTKLIAHFDEFAQISAKVEYQIEKSIMHCADMSGSIAGQQIVEHIKQETHTIIDEETRQLRDEIKTLISDLGSSINMATKVLNDKKKSLTKTGYLVTGTFCFSSLLVAFGIHYLFPRTTTFQLNDNMARAYFVGERILNNWSKLNDKEKDKILALTTNP